MFWEDFFEATFYWVLDEESLNDFYLFFIFVKSPYLE